MRILVCVAVLASAVSLHAQVNGVMLPVPALPAIGLPLPRLGLPPAGEQRSGAAADAGRDQRQDRRRGRAGRLPTVVVLPTVVIASAPAPESSRETRAHSNGAQASEPGLLELVVASDAPYQVQVDGHFVGNSDDVAGRWLSLEPGPHTIELRAEGVEPRRFNVRITAGQTLTYRTVLHGTAPTSEPATGDAAPHPTAGPIYVIAGCYAGNVAPDRVTLPAGCDSARVLVIHPQGN